MGSETILFVGGHYEVASPATDYIVTKYYFAGATRIAMRTYTIPQSSTLTYLLGDHLGSTSLTTDDDGDVLVETLYKPWGEVRSSTPGALPTRYTYTGQYSYVSDAATGLDDDAGFGLMYYNARWYDSALGRFSQADSIIPGAGDSQAWDRFAYVKNSPVRYTDPTGHKCAPEDECAGGPNYSAGDILKGLIKKTYGINMSDRGYKPWTLHNLVLMYLSLKNIDNVLNGNLKSIVEGATFEMQKQIACGEGGCQYHGVTHLDGSGIDFYTIGSDPIRQMNIYHEVGHLLDNAPGYKDVFTKAMENLDNPSFVDGPAGGIVSRALISKEIYTDPNYPLGVEARQTYTGGGPSEQWADAFGNYVAGNINLNKQPGADMYNFVTGALAPYIGTP